MTKNALYAHGCSKLCRQVCLLSLRQSVDALWTINRYYTLRADVRLPTCGQIFSSCLAHRVGAAFGALWSYTSYDVDASCVSLLLIPL